MNPSSNVLKLAMQLPENQRAFVAHELLLSLEPDIIDNEAISAVWVQEIEDRLRKLAQGSQTVLDRRATPAGELA